MAQQVPAWLLPLLALGLGLGLSGSLYALPSPPPFWGSRVGTVAEALAHPRAERDALCKDLNLPMSYLDLAGLQVGPPAVFEVMQREVMGGSLGSEFGDAAFAAELLGRERQRPHKLDQAHLEALAARVGELGAGGYRLLALLGDDAGYHGGAGILLREDVQLRFSDGTLVCAQARDYWPPPLEQLGCVLAEKGDPRWYRCP